MAIVQRSEDALAQSVRCGGIEWATKRKPRKPILPMNNPRVSVPIPKRKDENNARCIALEPPRTKKRAGSNPGSFLYTHVGDSVLERGVMHIMYTRQGRVLMCFDAIRTQAKRKQF